MGGNGPGCLASKYLIVKSAPLCTQLTVERKLRNNIDIADRAPLVQSQLSVNDAGCNREARNHKQSSHHCLWLPRPWTPQFCEFLRVGGKATGPYSLRHYVLETAQVVMARLSDLTKEVC